MKGRADSVMMVTLYMDHEGIMPLVLEDGKIVVSISNTQLIAKGTPLNDKLYEFIDKRNSLEVKIEELERKEARMVLDGANLDDVHGQLAKEGEALVKEMNDYVRQFIVDNFENVLGPSVFMMMCSTIFRHSRLSLCLYLSWSSFFTIPLYFSGNALSTAA